MADLASVKVVLLDIGKEQRKEGTVSNETHANFAIPAHPPTLTQIVEHIGLAHPRQFGGRHAWS